VNRRARQNKSSGTSRRGSAQPQQIESNVRIAHRYRFVSTNGASTAITPSSLLLASGSVGTVTNSTVVSLATAVKVNHIEMWCPPASQGSSATVSLDWIGTSVQQPNREFSDTTVSTAVPAHLHCRPPAGSLAAFWQQASTNTLFKVVAPPGTIIDVSLSLIISDGDANQASVAVATAVIGTIYYMSLDPNATHLYTPVSLTTTT